MNITITHSLVSLQLSHDELSILKKSINMICSEFSRSEFKTRIGFFVERAEVISNLFFQQLHAIQSQQTSFSLLVNMPNGIDDLELLNNILNEVCNGIRIANFQETIGFSIEKVKAMLNERHQNTLKAKQLLIPILAILTTDGIEYSLSRVEGKIWQKLIT